MTSTLVDLAGRYHGRRGGGGSGLGAEIARSIMHAAIWRSIWSLPLYLAIGLGIAAAAFLYFRRR